MTCLNAMNRITFRPTTNQTRPPTQEGHVAVAEVLLTAGNATVDAQIGDGSAALYIACFNGHGGVADLVGFFASISDRCSALLDIFIPYTSQPLFQLLEKGADLESGNRRGWRPLHIASARGHTWLAANLIRRSLRQPSTTGSRLLNKYSFATRGEILSVTCGTK